MKWRNSLLTSGRLYLDDEGNFIIIVTRENLLAGIGINCVDVCKHENVHVRGQPAATWIEQTLQRCPVFKLVSSSLTSFAHIHPNNWHKRTIRNLCQEKNII